MSRTETNLNDAITAVENLRGNMDFQSMLLASNTTTGETDTTLTDAVQSLIDGYGGGGGLPDGIAEAAYTEFSVTISRGAQKWSHGLTTVPDIIVVLPKFFFNTQDNHIALMCVSKSGVAYNAVRNHTTGTQWYLSALSNEANYPTIDNTFIETKNTNGEFKTNWIDENGNTGIQVYQSIAIKFGG